MASDLLEPLLDENKIGILDGGLVSIVQRSTVQSSTNRPTSILGSSLFLLIFPQATHLEDALSQSISSGPLWSASLLDSNPSSISQAHSDFLQAGSQIIGTANYQASFEGYEKIGYSREKSIELMKLAVDLASQERDRFVERRKEKGRGKPLVALSLGPYGAVLQNGSEYTGDYSSSLTSNSQPSISQLTEFHLNRLRVFTSDQKSWNQIDLIAFETIPRLDEALAIKQALKILSFELQNGLEMKPCYLSFVFPDGKGLPWKESEDQDQESEILEILQTILNKCQSQDDESSKEWPVLGLGINCTKPYFISSLSKLFKKALISLQASSSFSNRQPYLFLYPDGGLVWDGIQRVWKTVEGEIVNGLGGEGYGLTSSPNQVQKEEMKVDGRARQWAEPVKKIALEALQGEGDKGWKGVFVGGCCKARTEDIRALCI